VFVPELDKIVKVEASTKGFITMKKNGIYKTLKKAEFVK